MVVIPAGPTFRISPGATTSTAIAVTSDTPVDAWTFLNDGGQPMQIKFFVGTQSTTTAYVSYPAANGSAYDITLQHAVDNQTVFVPVRLQDDFADFGGFTTTIVISAITASGSSNLTITPVQVPNRGQQ